MTYKILMFAITALSISGVLLFEQNGYTHVVERAEKVRYNPDYVKKFELACFKYNRTNVAINSTIDLKIDIDKSLKVEVQAYKFLSNEYRLFPLRFSYNLCEVLARNEFGMGDFSKCGNLTRCPMEKGLYTFCNWAPDCRKFPPLIPEGRYMVDVKLFKLSTEILFLRVYATLKDILPWERY